MEKKVKKLKKKKISNIEAVKSVRTKKNKRGLIIKILIGLIAGIFIYFAFISTSENKDSSVFERLDLIRQDKRPFLLVVHDEFSPVGRENDKIVKGIIKNGENLIDVFNIVYDPNNINNESRYFIEKYDLESLPVVVLFDDRGDIVEKYNLPLKEKEIIDRIKMVVESSVE